MSSFQSANFVFICFSCSLSTSLVFLITNLNIALRHIFFIFTSFTKYVFNTFNFWISRSPVRMRSFLSFPPLSPPRGASSTGKKMASRYRKRSMLKPASIKFLCYQELIKTFVVNVTLLYRFSKQWPESMYSVESVSIFRGSLQGFKPKKLLIWRNFIKIHMCRRFLKDLNFKFWRHSVQIS